MISPNGVADRTANGHTFAGPGEEDTCPPGCVEHYRGGKGERWRNHSTAPRYVTVPSATQEDHVVSLGVWLEVREDQEQAEPTDVVGVLEHAGPEQAEMSPTQLRALAAHLLDVANLVDRVALARQVPVRVSAVVDNAGAVPVEVRRPVMAGSSVQLTVPTTEGAVLLSPADARRLGQALITAAG